MRMRLISGRWYTNFRWKGKKIEMSLDAYEKQSKRAQTNLGKVLGDLENGINPTSARKIITRLEIKGRINDRTEQLLRKHILPFFGELKPREVDEETIEQYIESRFGLNDSGELQAFGSTLRKELLILKRLLQSVYGKNYNLPKVSYKKLYKKILPPLSLEQIERVAEDVLDEYKPVYWLMAYTGMDVSDVVYLKPCDFKDGWIIKERGKTGIDINLPICAPLAHILKPLPWPIKQDERIFPEMDPDAAGSHIRRCFTKAGLDGYGAKYLRRFIASIMLDNGYSNDWIGKALAHAEGSKITKRYSKVYRDTLEEAFGKITGRGKKVGNGILKK